MVAIIRDFDPRASIDLSRPSNIKCVLVLGSLGLN